MRIGDLRARLGEPVDGASLVVFRAAFGALMVLAMLRFFAYGWIDALYLRPRELYPYWGFEWVQRWPAWGMYLHFALVAALSGCVALGRAYRPAIAAFFVGFTYLELLDRTSYLNHYYLISILALLMSFMPLGRGASAGVPRWCLWALRLQVALVYFYAGLAKLQPEWLLEGQPLGIWLAARSDLPVLGPVLAQPWAPYACAWFGALFDLSFPFWMLLAPRARPYAFLVGVVFHLLTFALFPIGIFPWVMIGCATLFFEPDWPRRLLQRLPWRVLAATRPARPLGRVACAALGLHFVLQALLPLRDRLYPGDTLWSEEGFRWGWRVMLVEKAGAIRFEVREPSSGRSWSVDPAARLTSRQLKMMATQPDMILTTAHRIAAEYRGRGVLDPEVRADAWVSLDGRPSRRLVDPTVDLAREGESLLPKRWILADQ